MQAQRSLLLILILVLWSPIALGADVTVTLPSGDGFVVRDSTTPTPVERLRVDEATGNVSRNGALFVHTTGTNNTFVGEGAGSNDSGAGSSAFGKNALSVNAATGVNNSAFGFVALEANSTGDDNSAFGFEALRGNTTGFYNSAFGSLSLKANTTGFENSALGAFALRSNTTGARNSAFGNEALSNNTTASDNSAFGRRALLSNTTGYLNSGFGASSLYSNTTGFSNSAFGRRSLRQNTTGNYNSGFGERVLDGNTTGFLNSAFGARALSSNTIGSYNSALGNRALDANTTGNGNIAVGSDAGSNQTTGSDNIYLANAGVAAEDGQIKIGTAGTHTLTHLVGEATLFDAAGSSAITMGGSGTLGPHGLVLDDDTAGAGLQVFFRTGPNALVIEKTSGGTGVDGTDAFSYDRDTDVFYLGGPVGVQRTTPSHPLHVGTSSSNGNGAHVTAGGTWTNGSSQAFKEDFEAVDPQAVLERVASLPITRWRYRGSEEGEHLGPVAEEFHTAFGLGADARYIATVDADGVALAAIQGLHAHVERQQRAIETLLARIEVLERGVAAAEETAR